jgi:hypothetical protein
MFINTTRRAGIGIAVLLLCLTAASQNTTINPPVPMADGLRSEGKIYVVVAVLLTILAGLFIYLWRLDRKISRLEKQEGTA